MVRIRISGLFGGVLVFFLLGCDTSPKTSVVTQGSFSWLQTRSDGVFQKYCVSCHGTGDKVLPNDLDNITNSTLMIDQAYIVPGQPEQSKVFQRVMDPDFPMPPRGYPAPTGEDRELLKNYILSIPVIDVNDDSIFEPEFSKVSTFILEPYCISCHGPSQSKKGVRLDGYDNVMKYITPGDALSSKLYQEIESGRMPPTGDVSPKQLQQLRTWIELGAENSKAED